MADIVHNDGDFYVVRERVGKSEAWCIYQNGVTAAKRVSTIGCSMGWPRVEREISRRKSRQADEFAGFVTRGYDLTNC